VLPTALSSIVQRHTIRAARQQLRCIAAAIGYTRRRS
jgi:hypothetical protein